MRLASPRLSPRQPFELEAEALLKIVSVAQLFDVIAGQRYDDRALIAIADRNPGQRLDLARETRPHALAFERQRQQLFLARLGLDCRGQHSRSCPARAMSRRSAVVHGHRATRLREAPSDPQPDDPGADDNGFRSKRRDGERRGNDGTPFAGHARPGSVGLISADLAAQRQLRGQPAPQPRANVGPGPCQCKDFLGLACVVPGVQPAARVTWDPFARVNGCSSISPVCWLTSASLAHSAHPPAISNE